MNTTSFAEAITFAEFLKDVRELEDRANRFDVEAYDLELDEGGALEVSAKAIQGKFEPSEEARQDLARLAKIPVHYFARCDAYLQAVSFNRLLRQMVPGGMPLQVVVHDGVMDRVLNSSLLPAPRFPILDKIANAIPENVVAADLRVIRHSWNGRFDISVIAPDLKLEPRQGDIVAFGINVSESRDGAVQVQGAAFRCTCGNGAVIRVCDGRRHRIRRPINRPDRLRLFLRRIATFAREAWRQWSDNAKGLLRLKDIPVDAGRNGTLRSRLRQAPFLLSAGVVDRVLRRLAIESSEEQDSNFCDLYNAMTWLGTHEKELSSTYRSRLRFGAGEFTRHETRVCSLCRQFVIS